MHITAWLVCVGSLIQQWMLPGWLRRFYIAITSQHTDILYALNFNSCVSLHSFSIWRYTERKNLEKKIKNRRINKKAMLNVHVAIAQWKFKNNYMLFILCSAVKTSKAKSIGFCFLLYCSSWVERLRVDAVIAKNNLQTKSRLIVRTCIVLLRPVKYVPLPLSSCRFQPNPRFCQINRKCNSKINCPNRNMSLK